MLTRRSPQESQFILVPLRSWAGQHEAAVTASRNSQGSTADIPGREIENKGIRRLEMPFRATPETGRSSLCSNSAAKLRRKIGILQIWKKISIF